MNNTFFISGGKSFSFTSHTEKMSFVVKYGVAFRSNEKGAVKIRGIFAGYITTCNGQIELGSPLLKCCNGHSRDAFT
ncbi:hypothetical protein SDC9_153599 [bioreactor metagenome]|uniref:Uncharacterized protein n=1 Tax=bioreactor metagenome TaxID=1076179 RepID=A0A645F109_9ZZZZ